MSINCRTDYELQSIAMPTQATTKKLFFNYTDEIDSCVKIRPQDFTAHDGSTPNYRSKVKNTDFLNCPDALSIRKGILEFALDKGTTEGTIDGSVSYQIPIDAEDWALGGVITFNLHAKALADLGGTNKYNVTVTLADVSDSASTNADTYTVTDLTTTEGNGQALVAISLSDVPTKIGGTGWGKKGPTSVKISVQESTKKTGVVGVGNFQVFDTIAEFAKNDVGWLTCLDTFEFNPSMDATDPDCVKVTLDPSSADTEITINAKKWSSNLLDASPLLELLDDEERAIPVMTKGVVNSDGLIHLQGFSATECGFIGAQSEDSNADDGRLKYMSLDQVKTLSEDQFQIVKKGTQYYARFNEDYIGSTITVIYPKAIEVEVYKISLNGGKVRPVRLMVPVDVEGGYDWYYSITGFFNNLPLGFSMTENSTAEFTFTPTPVNGYIGEVIKSKESN